MRAQPYPGASGFGGAPRHPRETSRSSSVAAAAPPFCVPTVSQALLAATAALSRCANATFNQQLQNAYAGAVLVRDSARAAARAAQQLPATPANALMVASLAQQVDGAERAMRDVLRFGRAHGHLAFAFPVHG